MSKKLKGTAEGTVKFSGIIGDEQPKQKVSDAVKRSGLTKAQKEAIWSEVATGILSRDNAVAVKKILQAELTGGTYIPPTPGQL
jgi:hypothetical protein